MNEYRRQLLDGIDEMEATIQRLREEIRAIWSFIESSLSLTFDKS